MMAIEQAQTSGARLNKACQLIEIGVRTIQRWRKDKDAEDMRMGPKKTPCNKLTKEERKKLLDIANSREYRNLPPSQIIPKLADKGIYLGSESTLQRILKAAKQDAHRGKKKQATKKQAGPKEKMATSPGQVFSWDITYLRSPVRGQYFYLYLMLDVWSRKIVGHIVQEAENSAFAAAFVREVYWREGSPKEVILHQDNGAPMKGGTLLATLQQLKIQPSYSRPGVSNDNPYSESTFGTMKTRPDYPDKPFADIEAARAWVNAFVTWHNEEHQHSSIGFVTPSQRHAGESKTILQARRCVYEKAKRKHPERWSGSIRKWEEPKNVFLNPTKETMAARNK